MRKEQWKKEKCWEKEKKTQEVTQRNGVRKKIALETRMIKRMKVEKLEGGR